MFHAPMCIFQVFLLLVFQSLLISPQIVFPEEAKEEIFCQNSCRNESKALCKCDMMCSIQGDCCLDSHYLGRHNSLTKFKCLPAQDIDAVYMVTNCKRRWRGPQEVIQNCTKIVDANSDPFGFLPVTDVQMGTTFKNQYCALCNGVYNFVPWNIMVSCPFSEERVSKNKVQKEIEYNPQTKMWGVWLMNTEKVREFFNCDISSQVPLIVAKKVRKCHGETISTCATDWKDNSMKRKCVEYLDPVTDGGVTYRNYHCALCNRIPPSRLACVRPEILHRAKIPVDFSMLMNFSNEGCVGGSSTCPCGSTWDPFFKKCRKIVSFPGR